MGRRPLDEQVRREIIRLAAHGLTYPQILERVDVSLGTLSRVLRPLGGVLKREMWHVSRTHLSVQERTEIYAGLRAGESFAAIARRIGRVTSTVSREVHGNGGRGGYRPFVAQHRAFELARRPKPSKLSCPRLRARVEHDLRRLWSPQQIATRLRSEFSGDPEMWISHETIYKSLFVQGRGELRRELARCLRTGRTQRKHHHRDPRGRIPEMINISERPAEVVDRAIPGHWEGDLLVGKNNKSAVATLVERATRYVLLAQLADQRAETVRDALIDRVATLPEHLWRSLTWDQGREMTRHLEFTQLTGITVYFCDPHSPWQRGSNENTNGLLRQYMPKGTDLSLHTQAQLDAIAIELNGRPRQTLGWQTPAEKLTELLATTG